MRNLEKLLADIQKRQLPCMNMFSWITKSFTDEELRLYYDYIQRKNWRINYFTCISCHKPIENLEDMFLQSGAVYHATCFVKKVNEDASSCSPINLHKDYFIYGSRDRREYFDRIFRVVFKIEPPTPPKK